MSGLGYGLVVVWECEWEQEVSSNRYIKDFMPIFFYCVYHVQLPTTPSFAKVVKNIKSGQFFTH